MKTKQTRQTKQLQQTEPYGLVEVNWSKLMLPLDKAHALQKLLCDALTTESIYGKGKNRTVWAIRNYDVPEVKVYAFDNTVDARCLNQDKFHAWRKTVAERPEGEESFLSPEEYDLFCEELKD